LEGVDVPKRRSNKGCWLHNSDRAARQYAGGRDPLAFCNLSLTLHCMRPHLRHFSYQMVQPHACMPAKPSQVLVRIQSWLVRAAHRVLSVHKVDPLCNPHMLSTPTVAVHVQSRFRETCHPIWGKHAPLIDSEDGGISSISQHYSYMRLCQLLPSMYILPAHSLKWG